MSDLVNLGPATNRLSDLFVSIDDNQLSASTPCDGYTVGDLLDHLSGLARGFAAAAAKNLGPMTSTTPAPAAANLGPHWRTEIPQHLDTLAQAWTDPAVWKGMTQIDGVTLPGSIAGQIALNELVLHSWDLALGSGQPYQQDPESLKANLTSLSQLYPPQELERRTGIFGPPIAVPTDAPLADRVNAFSGRDPDWGR